MCSELVCSMRVPWHFHNSASHEIRAHRLSHGVVALLAIEKTILVGLPHTINIMLRLMVIFIYLSRKMDFKIKSLKFVV